MSSSGTLAAGDYTKKTVEMALSKRDFCMGFISTSRLTEVRLPPSPSRCPLSTPTISLSLWVLLTHEGQDGAMVHMTPGVQLEAGTDNLGQRYLTPEIVITERTSGSVHPAPPARESRLFTP